MKKRFRYTQEMIKFLKEITPGNPIQRVTCVFNKKFNCNKTYDSVWSALKRNNIRNGIDAKFKKGSVPHNKGKKFYYGEKTQFKKGHLPANTKPVGSESVIGGYVKIKIANPNTWVFKHRFLYEQKHGPIPANCTVVFADGNRNNFDTDNLVCVTRAELAVLNRSNFIFNDVDVTNAGVSLAKLKIKLSKIKKYESYA